MENSYEEVDGLGEQEQKEIADLVKEGYTSGRLDREDGLFTAWELHITQWK